MRISDWISDVALPICLPVLLRTNFANSFKLTKDFGLYVWIPVQLPKNDLKQKLLVEIFDGHRVELFRQFGMVLIILEQAPWIIAQIGRASCRERVCQYV